MNAKKTKSQERLRISNYIGIILNLMAEFEIQQYKFGRFAKVKEGVTHPKVREAGLQSSFIVVQNVASNSILPDKTYEETDATAEAYLAWNQFDPLIRGWGGIQAILDVIGEEVVLRQSWDGEDPSMSTAQLSTRQVSTNVYCQYETI